MRDKAVSLLAFIAMVAGPFLKTYLVGGFSQDLQLIYLKTFFVLQFLIPICNFGLAWEYTRNYIETDVEHPFQLSILTVVFALTIMVINPFWGMVVILAICHSCWTYFLQIRRLAGQKYVFMGSRITKVSLDLGLLMMVLYCVPTLSIQWIIGIEIIAVVTIISVLAFGWGLRIQCVRTLWAGLNRHFAFVTMRVSEANYTRLGLPFLFPQEKFVQIFFILVGYEYICQFANLNFIRNFLDDQNALRNLIIFIVATLPLQAGLVSAIAWVYEWDLGMIEIAVIMIQGNMMILLLMFVRIVRKGDTDNYFKYVVFNIIVGLVFMLLAWMSGISGIWLYAVLVIPKMLETSLLLWRLQKNEVQKIG